MSKHPMYKHPMSKHPPTTPKDINPNPITLPSSQIPSTARAIHHPAFQPGTHVDALTVAFRFVHGALGDFICWMPALQYISKFYAHVDGVLICPAWFKPLAENFMQDFWVKNPKANRNWKFFENDEQANLPDGTLLKQPALAPLNATMMHLVDLGYVYFAGLNPAPNGHHYYPVFDGKNVDASCFNLEPKTYVVLTPGHTSPSRRMQAKTFNRIVEHVLSLGLTPVFLGTDNMKTMKGKDRPIFFDEGYDLTKGVNLINKTDLLLAAKVMADSLIVVGLDNGLLHLAATSVVPIVFGYSIAGPQSRRPYRSQEDSILAEVAASAKELPCTFCQEKIRFMNNDFSYCVFGNYKCLDLLDGDSFCRAIDAVMSELNKRKNLKP